MNSCDHQGTIKLDWSTAREVKGGVIVVGGVCRDCGTHVKTKLERRGTINRSDFYLEGLEAFG